MTTTASTGAPSLAPNPLRTSPATALTMVWLASAAVIAASLLASFRLGFAHDLPTLLTANGPRVLFAAAVGVAFALSGALRLSAGALRPLTELEWLALSTGAAAGGFLFARGRAGSAALALFAFGVVVGALLLRTLVRALDRPRRWTNVAIALALPAMAGLAAFTGTYARERSDLVAPAVGWLLGDVAGATFASGLAVLVLVVALVIAAVHALGSGARSRLALLARVALGLGIGAAGPLAFVGTLPARAVRGMARGTSEAALLMASAAVGAAAVVAVDTVPRLLMGGYELPWNFTAAVLAIPVFLTWNRLRLRREAGRAGLAFEIAEVAIIAALTLAIAWHAFILAWVIRLLT